MVFAIDELLACGTNITVAEEVGGGVGAGALGDGIDAPLAKRVRELMFACVQATAP